MAPTLPLEGIRVLDFSTYVAAPICSAMLADWGADVIKIESTTGDVCRLFGLFAYCPARDDDNIQFELSNRNKRGISINLKTDEGKEIIHALLKTADVLITNYRPKALASLALDYESISRKYPRIVYASLDGYGDCGPDKDKPGFDLTAYFARSGFLVEMSDPGEPPVSPIIGFGDIPTGTILAGGICAALLSREKTGQGCKVQSALVNTALWNLQMNIAVANNNDHLPEEEFNRLRPTRKRPRSALANTYKTSDGRWITILVLEHDRYWKSFAETVLLRPDLVDDSRFNNQMACLEYSEELAAVVAEELEKYTKDDIVARLKAADIAHEVNPRWHEIKDDAQCLENGFINEYKMPSGRKDWMVGNPVRFNGEKTSFRRYAPRLGEHTDEVLAELGYSAEQISALRDNKIIG